MNFIVWHLLRGKVRVRAENAEIEAGAGAWVLMAHRLGRRHQEFSPDALIQSLHLGLETAPAEWTGPSLVVLEGTPELKRSFTQLGKYVVERYSSGLKPGGHVHASRNIAELTQVQRRMWSFLEQLVPILHRTGMSIRAPNLRDPRFAASMALIESWPVNLRWNRGEISRSISLSASQLDRIWRENRGQTPLQYWNDRRIRFACDRLENTGCSIKEIAFDLGFAHQAQFSTWFRSRMDISPRDYRGAFVG